jgi:hypothetical protein
METVIDDQLTTPEFMKKQVRVRVRVNMMVRVSIKPDTLILQI